MKRIAVISDIHGNLPALQAVLKDIKDRNIDTIFCLGDLIGMGPSGGEVTDLIAEYCEQVVRGNWDEFIANTDNTDESIMWYKNQLGQQRLEYLRNLPFSIEFMMSGKYIRLFHASPRSAFERIYPWDSMEVRQSMFLSSELTEEREADVAGYGDIHGAYMQHIQQKTLFNVGSVGNPLDIPQSSYVILEGIYHSAKPGPFTIQFVRVPYDIELAVQQAIDANTPSLEEYIEELRTAVYRGRKYK